MTTHKKRKTDIAEDPAIRLAAIADRLSLTALRDEIPALLARAEKEAPSYSDFAIQLQYR